MALRQPLTERNRWKSSLEAVMAIHLSVVVMMFMELSMSPRCYKAELSLVYVTVFY